MIVISDVNMPNMDGLTMIGEVRKLPQYAKTPILVLTTERGDDMKIKVSKLVLLDGLLNHLSLINY